MADVVSTAGLIVRHLVVLSGLGLLSFILGRTLSRFDYRDVYEEVAFCTALGMGGFGLCFFVLGLAGRLAPWGCAMAVVVLQLLCAKTWARVARRVRTTVFSGKAFTHGLILAVPLAAAFILGLYPPTAFDATSYHLPFARAFAEQHRLVVLPYRRYIIFPHVAEVLVAPLLFIGSDTLSHLIEWMSAALTALALYATGVRLGSTRIGLWAAALWLGNPLVVSMAGAAFVDLTCTLFAILGALAWAIWAQEDDRRYLLLSAALIGSAAGTKYLGLLSLLLLLPSTLVVSWHRRRLSSFFAFAALSAGVLGPWYLRIFLVTGNPVFPYLAGVFGGMEWAGSGDVVLAIGGNRGVHALLSLLSERLLDVLSHPHALVLLPWHAAFARSIFNSQPPTSWLYIGLVPLIAFACVMTLWKWRTHPKTLAERYVVGAALGSLAYATPYLSRDIRYMLPIGAALALAGAIVIDGTWRSSRRELGTLAVAALLIAHGLGYAAYRLLKQGAIPTNAAARDAYLERRFGAYPALALLNRQNGKRYTVYALHAENLAYFAEGEFLGDWVGPARFEKVLPTLHDSARLYQTLLGLGADHFLVNRGQTSIPLPEDDFFRNHFRPLLRTSEVELFEVAPLAGS